MKQFLLVLTTLFFFSFSSFSQVNCSSAEVEVYFEINVTNWAYEVSYDLIDGNNNVVFSGQLSNSSDFQTENVCVDTNACLLLTVYDTYGDGINQNGDYFFLVLGTDTVVSEADYNFGNEVNYEFNCPTGATCSDPFTVQVGVWTGAQYDNTWYEFTPDSTGLYSVTTCDSNTCNTQLWIFEDCTGNIFTENEEGALSYSNDAVICSPQSDLQSALQAGITYYIRVGDYNDNCTDTINWLLTYEGPVVGCMDPTKCNYEPLATVSGPCYDWGSPECPDGPDLIMDQQYAINTISLDNIYMDPNSNYDLCQVQEGCVRGMGNRTIIRFATRIANIGVTDYYIGTPGANPSQFDFTNCHGHTHYKGYAEYLLYDPQGNEIPVGFKAGFCVMDIECSGGGTGGYNCGNMGISAGCSDIYGSGTTCNWIDITDVDTGDYTFVLRTNWDFDPDALGRYETDHLNNWAQVCINIGMDNQGNKTFSLNPNCPTFSDCDGVAYGDAELDCNGVCNGTAVQGDINLDEYQNLADAQTYVTEILSNGAAINDCNDLNGDGEITIFDAALIQDCYYGEFDTTHAHGAQDLLNHCEFPYGYTNIGDTVWLTISDYNLQDQWFEVSVKNPYNTILGYEFEMSGLEITTADNMIPTAYYPITPETALGGDKVIGMSYQDSVVPKSFVYVPLVRVNYFQLMDSTICISDVMDVISGRYEATVVIIENGCVQLSSSAAVSIQNLDTICSNAGGISLQASPNGGYFFGDGVIGEIFYPEVAGPGVHEVFYYYPQQLPVSTFVTVLDADVIGMVDSVSLMDTDAVYDLVATPAGGNFSGVGVSGNQFDPSLAGVGEHIITYTYALPNGCIASKEMVVNVGTAVSIIDLENILNVNIKPNPFNNTAVLSFENPKRVSYTLEIVNSVGQIVRTYSDLRDETLIIEKGALSDGVYIYRLNGEYKNTGRFVIY